MNGGLEDALVCPRSQGKLDLWVSQSHGFVKRLCVFFRTEAGVLQEQGESSMVREERFTVR